MLTGERRWLVAMSFSLEDGQLRLAVLLSWSAGETPDDSRKAKKREPRTRHVQTGSATSKSLQPPRGGREGQVLIKILVFVSLYNIIQRYKTLVKRWSLSAAGARGGSAMFPSRLWGCSWLKNRERLGECGSLSGSSRGCALGCGDLGAQFCLAAFCLLAVGFEKLDFFFCSG